MYDFVQDSLEKFKSAEKFADSYTKGNGMTDDEPYPEWAIMLKCVAQIMRTSGMDAEDMENALEDDLNILKILIARETACPECGNYDTVSYPEGLTEVTKARGDRCFRCLDCGVQFNVNEND